MKHRISNELSKPLMSNTVRITERMFAIIGQCDRQEWSSLFNEFRLNLQSRIAGSDERELLKLQAKIEQVNELDKFFENLISAPAKLE